MSQTFLEDIPEFLEIQRNSFLRVLDTGLIQAFEKINPIVPTSQCKYGLLFYPKEYVLILPEHTITEAFLQGKTYGCKIYVPAVIYTIESSYSSPKKSGNRFKSLKALRITKTTGSRFSEETFFGTQETRYNLSNICLVEMKRTKGFFFKGEKTLSWDCFLTMLLGIENFSKKKKTLLEKSQPRSNFFQKTRENKPFFFMSQISNRVGWSRFLAQPSFSVGESLWELGSKDNLLTKPNLSKSKLINFTDRNSYFSALKPYQQMVKPTLHYLLKKRLDKDSVLVFKLKTAQKTRKKLSQTSKKNFLESEKSNLFETLPKTIRQKSKLAFFQKIPNWVRGRSNTSLIHEALNRLQDQKQHHFPPVSTKKKGSKEWLLPFLKRSLIHPKLSKVVSSHKIHGTENSSLFSEGKNFTANITNSLTSLTRLAKPVSRKEWVCIGILPLMTPRGHFIINGSHRIIISQMARAPGLYYQTGEKMQATIVPSKGAWLRLSIKASDNGEIKIWVRITPQRKMPYKIFIETYKHLEISKTILNKTGSKFLNLTYKTLNSKIKHLDKHYAIGVVSGQVNRTLLNSSSYSLGVLGRKRLNERLGINETKGHLTSKDITLIKDNLLKILGQKSTDLSADDIDHLENRRVRTCGELLQTEIETGMSRLKKAIGKQLDEYSSPDSSIFNTFKDHALENKNKPTNLRTSDVYPGQKSSRTGELPLNSLDFLSFLADNHYNKQGANLIKLQNPVLANLKIANSWPFLAWPYVALLGPTWTFLSRLGPSWLCPSGQEGHSIATTRNVTPRRLAKPTGPWNFFWLKSLNKQNWLFYTANLDQALTLFKDKKSGLFWKKNENLFLFKKNLDALLLSATSSQLNTDYKFFYQPQKIGITLAQNWLDRNSEGYEKKTDLDPLKKLLKSFTSPNLLFSQSSFTQEKNTGSPLNSNSQANFLSPSKIIGTKAFAGALREFFGSNPLSQYMDQTNPLAEITHKRRLSSLGPGGVDRASAGIAIRGIHPSHYGRICPIETPEGKNAGLVNSMTMWARINNDGFLETPYFKVKGGSLMSQTNNLTPHWNYITTKLESQGALKIVSSDLKIAESAFLPSIALPTRDGSERSFRREKRDYIHFCGISPMQNISVATSLIPFLEHDDATRALMGSNMQRQAVPLLRAKEPLIRTGLEGKVVGESGHALQASCNGIISIATRTFIAIDSFDILKNSARDYSPDFYPIGNTTSFNFKPESLILSPSSPELSIRVSSSAPNRLNKPSWQKNRKFFSNIENLSFLKGNRLQKSNNYHSQDFFLARKPVNSLFYPLNYSFKGFLKSWLNTGWRVGNFYDVIEIQGQEKLEQELIQKNEKSSTNRTPIFKNSIYQQPKTLNCWRTFIYRFARTKTEQNKNSKSTILKKRHRLLILDPAQQVLVHSTFLTFFNQKKKPKQKISVGGESPFFSYRNVNCNSSYVYFKRFPTLCSLPSKGINQTKQKQDWTCFASGALLNFVTHRKKEVITKTLWRENFKITRKRKIHNLQQYTRSNQATVCVQRPAVSEGRWVQKGDLIGDCSASKNGILALGQNIVVAYLPMEGFNFEDAIVVSDRLVHEELYTSLHVQRVEFDMDALVKKHIPRKIKVKKQKSAYKTSNQDWITLNNPHLLESEKENLNPLGIITVGSWVGPGDVLVSKVFPVERKIAPSRHLLAAVFQEKKTKILDTDDTSVRVPKGIHGRVINVKIVGVGKTASLPLHQSCESLSSRKNNGDSPLFSILCQAKNSNQLSTSEIKTEPVPNNKKEQGSNGEKKFSDATNAFFDQEEKLNPDFFKNNSGGPSWLCPVGQEEPRQEAFLTNKTTSTSFYSLDYKVRHQRITKSFLKGEQEFKISKIVHALQTENFSSTKKKLPVKTFPINPIFFAERTGKEQGKFIGAQGISVKLINNYSGITFNANPALVRRVVFQELINQDTPLANNDFFLEKNFSSKGIKPAHLTSREKNQGKPFPNGVQRASVLNSKNLTKKNGPSSFSELSKKILSRNSTNTQEYKITGVRIYIAERKKLQVGDKMSGRHGNKGIVSTILPREDMPYLPDGTPVDMVLNPLGIPSRMNVGQVFECLFGLAASMCGESFGHTPFDEMYGPEASRSLVYLFLYVSRLRSHADWIFQPNFPGKTLLFDGRTGSPFEQWVTVGRAYMLKLIHMVDEKIHARSIGPRSLVTQQPVKGRARGGGQRLGEMEIWAFEGFGAAYTLQEILTIKSDDIKGREEVESSIISARPLTAHIPETFRITLFELRCLCLNLELNQNF